MKQYHDLLNAILTQGTNKKPARENMPGTRSLFGYQMRFDLQQGFPMLTTKKLSFKNIVIELLWFLNGDTNIKYLVDNGCNIWNEDAYNYYVKLCKKQGLTNVLEFENFLTFVKGCIDLNDLRVNSNRNSETDTNGNLPCIPKGYILGDCGKQYGKLWREWKGLDGNDNVITIDQIGLEIELLKTNPLGRRHCITAWNPATLDDMALNACHAFVQFNARELTYEQRIKWFINNFYETGIEYPILIESMKDENLDAFEYYNDVIKIPKYYLDCQMYQRSADVFLGVPYNIASYALLTYILAQVCNMIPGEFIHTFGDVHIYDNHINQVNEILARDVNKYPLPTLEIKGCPGVDWTTADIDEILKSIEGFEMETFVLNNYEAYQTIKAPLSTGLIK